MRVVNGDGKDEKIAEAIQAGKAVDEIRAELGVSSKRIARVRKTSDLPVLRPGANPARVMKERAIDVPVSVLRRAEEIEKDLSDLHDLVEWHEKREYELLDLVANLSDDNIKLRVQIADLTPADEA